MYFDNGIKANNFDYFEYVDGEITKINTIEVSNLETCSWVFSNKDDSLFVSNFNKCDSNVSLGDYFNIQHGFATLRDSVFISKYHAFVDYCEGVCLFNGFLIENALVRPIVKGSKYRGNPDDYSYIIYPYEKIEDRWVVIGEEKLKTNYPLTYSYFLSNKDELLKRDSDKNALWYEFGRSQGVQTMHGEKIVCDTLVNDRVLFYKLPCDVMVYSGVFITKKTDDVSWDLIENVLKSEDFLRYVKITGKDFSGNYKSISTKQIKNYKIACEEM
jgi:adenine-specific DNA-methyltransferase